MDFFIQFSFHINIPTICEIVNLFRGLEKLGVFIWNLGGAKRPLAPPYDYTHWFSNRDGYDGLYLQRRTLSQTNVILWVPKHDTFGTDSAR